MNQSKMIDKKKSESKRLDLSDDLLWGIHPVLAAVEESPERILEILLIQERKGRKLEEIIQLARKHKIKVSLHSSFKLNGENAADVRHQGILARVAAVPLLSLKQMVDKFQQQVQAGEKPRLVVCDSLQDPHNLGAILRSACASGASGVIITRERSAPLGGTAAKASAGALSLIDICQVSNLSNALQELKKVGAWIFGAVKESAAQSIYTTDFKTPACIVIGSEGTGIRPLVRSQCDFLVSIPMVGKLDSLNSSVAAAVILFEALRQNSPAL